MKQRKSSFAEGENHLSSGFHYRSWLSIQKLLHTHLRIRCPATLSFRWKHHLHGKMTNYGTIFMTSECVTSLFTTKTTGYTLNKSIISLAFRKTHVLLLTLKPSSSFIAAENSYPLSSSQICQLQPPLRLEINFCDHALHMSSKCLLSSLSTSDGIELSTIRFLWYALYHRAF